MKFYLKNKCEGQCKPMTYVNVTLREKKKGSYFFSDEVEH
jgi:hypothetical protein